MKIIDIEANECYHMLLVNANYKEAFTMKILVFGVGAIGSLMVHYLCEAGNDVTVVARSTYEELNKNGLVIRHYLQKKTTVDHPRIVKEADDRHYDIAFSVMQGQQQLTLGWSWMPPENVLII